MAIWGMKAQIKGITRPAVREGTDRLGGSCIDNIFTNSEHITGTMTLDWNSSDHLAVAVRRKRERITHKKIAFQGRSYMNYVKENLQLELLQADWGPFYQSVDPSTGWELLEAKIRDYLDRECPIKNFKVKEVKEPWVTNELLEEIKDKDRLLREAKRSGRVEDLQRAKVARNRVGRLVEQTKADFLKDQQELLADDPKKFWRTVKSIILGKKSATGSISLVEKKENNEKKDVGMDQVAEFINTLFSNIGPKLASNHNKAWRFKGERLEEECPDFTASHDRVLKLCKEINTIRSSGIAGIATKVFKDAFLVLIPQLVFLFNLSFATGSFPEMWKKATIKPLYKGGDKTEVGNCRPVSLLPLPGKLIEKVVHSGITYFLERFKIISDRQSGFRKGFSTASSIADLTNLLFNNINKGNFYRPQKGV